MPRIDSTMPPDESRRIRQELGDAIWRFDSINDAYNYNSRSWGGSPEIRLSDDAQPDESFDTYTPAGPAFADPINDALTCRYCRNGYAPYPLEGCHQCRRNVWTRCPGCTDTILTGQECGNAFTCDGCGERGCQEGGPTLDDSSNRYCSEECAENAGYTECNSCSVWTMHESNYCTSHQPCECGHCYECRQRSNIHSYSYKPRPVFHGPGPVYLGMECEISTAYCDEGTSSVARAVHGKVRRIAYLKSDSSIGSGFELVTHPMSYDWAMENFPWDLFPMLTNDYGVRHSESCGIHVHVNRDGFADAAHMYRWQKFFYRNARAIKLLARRDSDEWASFDSDGRALALAVAKSGPGEINNRPGRWWRNRRFDSYPYVGRYSAINVQNTATLEVRVFAGSVETQPVQAALGMVDASVEYTRRQSARQVLKEGAWTFDAFADWASKSDRYTPLTREIERLVKN